MEIFSLASSVFTVERTLEEIAFKPLSYLDTSGITYNPGMG